MKALDEVAGCSSRAGTVRVQSAVRLWHVTVVGGGRIASCGALVVKAVGGVGGRRTVKLVPTSWRGQSLTVCADNCPVAPQHLRDRPACCQRCCRLGVRDNFLADHPADFAFRSGTALAQFHQAQRYDALRIQICEG